MNLSIPTLTDQMLALAEAHIDSYYSLPEEFLRTLPAFETDFRVMRLQMSRRTGHTTAAVALAQKYNAALFAFDERRRCEYIREYGISQERVFNVRSFRSRLPRLYMPALATFHVAIIDTVSMVSNEDLTRVLECGIFTRTPIILLG